MKARVEYSTVDQHKEQFETDDEALTYALWVVKTEPVGTNVVVYGVEGKVITLFTSRPYS